MPISRPDNSPRHGYAIPFGRHVDEADRPESNAGLFVGREGQRAFLIDALTSAGRRGAFLVTGRRGVGKTSFVEYCLSEYKASVFKRFLRSTHGRSFWDLFTTITVISAIIYFGLVLSDLLEVSVGALTDNPLLWIVILSVALLFIYPLIYAQTILRTIVELTYPEKTSGSFARISAGLFFVIFISIMLFLGPTNAPSLSVSRLILCISVAVYADALLPLVRANDRRWVIKFEWILAILVVGVVYIDNFFFGWVNLVNTSETKNVSTNLDGNEEILSNAILCVVLISIYFFSRTFSQLRLNASAKPKKTANEWGQGGISSDEKNAAIKGTQHSFVMHLILGIASIAILFLILFWFLSPSSYDTGSLERYFGVTPSPYKTIATFFVLSVVAAVFTFFNHNGFDTYNQRCSRPRRFKFRLTTVLMVLKALMFAVVALQLLYPISGLRDTIFDVSQSNLKTHVDQRSKKFFNVSTTTPILKRLSGNGPKENQPEQKENTSSSGNGSSENQLDTKEKKLPITLFIKPEEEIAWLFLILIAIGLITFLEYDWIIRPQVSQRDARVLDPDIRSHWLERSQYDPVWDREGSRQEKIKHSSIEEEGRQKNFRQLEAITIPWLMCRIWMPTLIVKVNLGIHALEHRDVIQTMLVGLRDEYVRNFLVWRAPYTALLRFVMLLVSTFVISFIATIAVDFPTDGRSNDKYKLSFSVEPKITDIITKKNGPEIADRNSLEKKNIILGVNYCSYLARLKLNNIQETNNNNVHAYIPEALCAFSADYANKLLPILFTPVFPIEIQDPELLKRRAIYGLLHLNNGLPRLERTPQPNEKDKTKTLEIPNNIEELQLTTQRSLTFRIYHFLMFLIFFWGLRHVPRHLSVLHYRAIVDRIDSVLEVLTAKTSEERKSLLSQSGKRLQRLLIGETTYSVNREKLDPRSVELLFLDILEEMQKTSFRVGSTRGVSVPTPEITFVFDELDKISGYVSPHTKKNIGEPNGDQFQDVERARSKALHALLSDMKRLISSAPARFIFVGNRLLHDKWVADVASRNPLLTSIFSTEIYLPTLIMDHVSEKEREYQKAKFDGKHVEGKLSDRIWESFYRKRKVALKNYNFWMRSRLVPFFGLPVYNTVAVTYNDDVAIHDADIVVRGAMSGDPIGKRASSYISDGAIYSGDTDEDPPSDDNWNKAFLNDFVDFLTFRSAGNPKKLSQLFDQFIRPVGRVVGKPAENSQMPYMRWDKFPCHDVLYFSDSSVYRIQFLSFIFNHVEGNFSNTLRDRDDKIVISVFHLIDFLLKFHGRAFSWSNLEQIDELADIHRAPDVRRVLTQLVNQSSERLLHRVLNGMYAFRFRSDLAAEIRYLSRVSDPEMAAFNFTLDESQSLKTVYKSLLAQEKTPNRDLIQVLGELHEYDQEYDLARQYYRDAIRLHDQTLIYHVGPTTNVEATSQSEQGSLPAWPIGNIFSQPGFESTNSSTDVSVLKGIISRDISAVENAVWFTPWGVQRLRLMLQIGMTYEQANDLEAAKLHYHNASSFALSLVEAFNKKIINESSSLSVETHHKSLLKQINILYQPFFAEAWVEEKMFGAVDTSTETVEVTLERLRGAFEFLNDANATDKPDHLGGYYDRHTGAPTRPNAIGHSNFALLGAELHNKAGDIYYFKGRQHVSYKKLDSYVNLNSDENDTSLLKQLEVYGYLLQAHYHYAVGLHELRRFIVHRRHSSAVKLNAFGDSASNRKNKRHNTIKYGRWPNFVLQSIYNNMSDMAEATLPRVSMLELVRSVLESQKSTLRPPTRSQLETANLLRALSSKPVEVQIETFHRCCIVWHELTDHEDFSAALKNDMKSWGTTLNTECAKNYHVNWINKLYGRWNSENTIRASEPYKRIISFHELSTSFERLIGGLHIAFAGARFARDSGYAQDAAREYLHIAEICSHYISWIQQLRSLSSEPSKSEKFRTAEAIRKILELDDLVQTEELEAGKTDVWRPVQKLCAYLFDMATHAFREYDVVVRSDSNTKTSDSYLVGRIISPTAVTECVSLLLTAAEFLGDSCKDECHASDQKKLKRTVKDDCEVRKMCGEEFKRLIPLSTLLRSWLGDSYDNAIRFDTEKHDTRKDVFVDKHISILLYVMSRNRFPLLNRLNILETLVNFCCVTSRRPNDRFDWFKDLGPLAKAFDGPLHFTPFMMGRVAANMVIYSDFRRDSDSKKDATMDALKHLRHARESYTMGRQYYDSFSDLYYLYDDFNDRQVHLNYCIQMAGMEIVSLLEEEMRSRRREALADA